MRYNWGSIITGSIVGTQTFGISNITFSNLRSSTTAPAPRPNPAPFTVDNFPEYQGQVPGQPATLYNQYPDAKFITGTGGNENTSYHGARLRVLRAPRQRRHLHELQGVLRRAPIRGPRSA